MKINAVKIKKFFTIILSILVGLLVVFAIYSNRSMFYNDEIIKYSLVTIDEKTDIQDIINKYSNNNNKNSIISEIKKINNLPDLSKKEIYGKTIYIPLTSN